MVEESSHWSLTLLFFSLHMCFIKSALHHLGRAVVFDFFLFLPLLLLSLSVSVLFFSSLTPRLSADFLHCSVSVFLSELCCVLAEGVGVGVVRGTRSE